MSFQVRPSMHMSLSPVPIVTTPADRSPAATAAPLQFEFEADNGMTVTATTDDPMKEQDLGVQFGDSA